MKDANFETLSCRVKKCQLLAELTRLKFEETQMNAMMSIHHSLHLQNHIDLVLTHAEKVILTSQQMSLFGMQDSSMNPNGGSQTNARKSDQPASLHIPM